MRDLQSFLRKILSKEGLKQDRPYPIEFDPRLNNQKSDAPGDPTTSDGEPDDLQPAGPQSHPELPELDQLDLADHSPIPGVPSINDIRGDQVPAHALPDMPVERTAQDHQSFAASMGMLGMPQAPRQAQPQQPQLPNRGDLNEPPMDHTYNHDEPDFRQAFSDILTPAIEELHASVQMQLMEAISEVKFDMERRHLI